MPRRMNRSSSDECSGSSISRACSSENTVVASSKEIPCLSWFGGVLPGVPIEGELGHVLIYVHCMYISRWRVLPNVLPLNCGPCLRHSEVNGRAYSY